MEKVFVGKAFRVVVLDGNKCGWEVEQDFYRNSRVSFISFLPFSPTYLTESCSVWFGLENRFPCTILQMIKLSLTVELMTSQGLRGTRVRPDG